MKRLFPLLVLIGFLVYIVVCLFRAFRVGEPMPGEVVQVWHGDTMLRAIRVAVLFLIGLVVEIVRAGGRGGRGPRIRVDLVEWLNNRSEATGESPEAIADRAIGAYRDRLEGARR